ncbi:MAG: SDR family NAD(P)-dependent oxidoreductase, partial [Nocardioidaceae bacterium]
AGDDVVIIGRRRDALERTSRELNAETGSDRVSFRSADLSDPEGAGETAAAIAAGGHVDVLVTNAGGVASGLADTLSAVADNWLADFRGNVLTAVLLAEALLPHLSRPGGRVIAMSSVAAVRGAGSYGAAKAALHAWVFDLAARLGADGITVNAVAPGFVPDTEFWDGRRTPEVAEPRIATTLVKRPGTPDEVAEAVSYLASPLAGFTTGQILQVNGGSVLGRG